MPRNSYSLLPSQQYRGYVDPKATLNPDAIGNVIDDLEKDYRVGQNFIDTMQEGILQLDVAEGDFGNLKNVSNQYQQDANSIVDKYEGRYEDPAFQREIKMLNTTYASDPKIKQMLETKKQVDIYNNIMSDPLKAGSVVNLTQGDPKSWDSFKQGVFRSELQQRYDYHAQAKDYFAHIKNDLSQSGLTDSSVDGFAQYITEEENWTKVDNAAKDAYSKYRLTDAGIQHEIVLTNQYMDEGLSQEEALEMAAIDIKSFLVSTGDSYKQKLVKTHYMNKPAEKTTTPRKTTTTKSKIPAYFSQTGVAIPYGVKGKPYADRLAAKGMNDKDVQTIKSLKTEFEDFVSKNEDLSDSDGKPFVHIELDDQRRPTVKAVEGKEDLLVKYKEDIDEYILSIRKLNDSILFREEFDKKAWEEAGLDPKARIPLVEGGKAETTISEYYNKALKEERDYMRRSMTNSLASLFVDPEKDLNLTTENFNKVLSEISYYATKDNLTSEDRKNYTEFIYEELNLQHLDRTGMIRDDEVTVINAGLGNIDKMVSNYKNSQERLKNNLASKDPNYAKYVDFYEQHSGLEIQEGSIRNFGTNPENDRWYSDMSERISRMVASGEIAIFDRLDTQEINKESLNISDEELKDHSKFQKRFKIIGWDVQEQDGLVYYANVSGIDGDLSSKTVEIHDVDQSDTAAYLMKNGLVHEALFLQEIEVNKGLTDSGGIKTKVGITDPDTGEDLRLDVEVLLFDEGRFKANSFKFTNFQDEVVHANTASELIDKYYQSLGKYGWTVAAKSGENNPFNLIVGQDEKPSNYRTLEEGVKAGVNQVKRYVDGVAQVDWKDANNPEGGAVIQDSVTLENFAYTYAPQGHGNNNPENYIKHILKSALGLSEDTVNSRYEELKQTALKDINFERLLEAIVSMEGNINWNTVKEYI